MLVAPTKAPVFSAAVPGTPVCKGYNSQGSCYATGPLVPDDFIGKRNGTVMACSFCRRRRKDYNDNQGRRPPTRPGQSTSAAAARLAVAPGQSRVRKTG